MADSLDKKVLEVAGLPTNKKVIKFKGDDTWYDIAENVQKYDLVKYGIVAGAMVDVTFDDKKLVIYLKVKKAGAKADTPPVQTAEPVKAEESVKEASTSSKVDTLVIQGVAGNKKVLKFKGQAGWSSLSDEIQKLDYDAVGIKAGNTVLVSFDDKGAITSISVEVPVEEITKAPGAINSYNNDAVANSIEAQVAWKGAVEVVVAMITTGVLLPQDIEAELKKLTAVGITAIASR